MLGAEERGNLPSATRLGPWPVAARRSCTTAPGTVWVARHSGQRNGAARARRGSTTIGFVSFVRGWRWGRDWVRFVKSPPRRTKPNILEHPRTFGFVSSFVAWATRPWVSVLRHVGRYSVRKPSRSDRVTVPGTGERTQVATRGLMSGCARRSRRAARESMGGSQRVAHDTRRPARSVPLY